MKILILLFACFNVNFSYNFLIFSPLFGHSHTTFFAKIADTLSEAGHNVVSFRTTNIMDLKNNDSVYHRLIWHFPKTSWQGAHCLFF